MAFPPNPPALSKGPSSYSGYCQLDKTKREIRVMSISGSSNPQISDARDPTAHQGTEMIEAHLHVVRLDNANPFYALSYVWGEPDRTAPIMIDGEIVYVRWNLWMFLCVLRERFCRKDGQTSLRVWLDYVCINQQDVSERNFQVSMMGEIFRGADAVYAWLGPASSASDGVFACIEEIKEMRATNRTWGSISREKQEELRQTEDILRRDYWTRLWIKQEVILPKDVWFFCGEKVTNWTDLQFAAQSTSLDVEFGRVPWSRRRSRGAISSQLGRFGAEEPGGNSGTEAMTSLLRLRSNTWTRESLSELVARFHDARCQDGRDRLYGLLSLIDLETATAINVDYTKPLLQVLLDTYPYWTGEELPSQNIHDAEANRSPLYQYESFCARISTLLSDVELQSLCDSEPARRMISAKAIFRTSPHRKARFHTIAAMDCNKLVPLDQLTTLTSSAQGFVTYVKVNGTPNAFIYTDSMPCEGDLFTNIGSRVFLFRRCQRRSSHGHGNTLENRTSSGSCSCSVVLAATGAIIASPLPTSALSGWSLQHPCYWMRQQLPDATFEHVTIPRASRVDHHDGRSLPHNQRFMILCNAAAIVTLLHESRASPRSQDKTQGEASWSPWHFGLQHQILEPCVYCKTQGLPGRQGAGIHATNQRTPSNLEDSKCRCAWRTAPPAFCLERGTIP